MSNLWGDSKWRQEVWSILDQHWDLIVIGGGITGAGIFREAVRAGLKTLLVDANDFASGTSSRSSKLVHGGLRYLRNGQIRLTYESVRERERLLKEGLGLIDPTLILLTLYKDDSTPDWVLRAGLIAYDLLAFKRNRHQYSLSEINRICPQISNDHLRAGFSYMDALTDDARLVLRVIQEAVGEGGVAINYARVIGLLNSQNPVNRARGHKQVSGVVLQDDAPDGDRGIYEVQSTIVINASGPWADQIRSLQPSTAPKLRKLRGSHLIFPWDRIPLKQAVSLFHPWDKRPLTILPWENVTIIGTTDIDHNGPPETDLAITPPEIDYLLHAVNYVFPCLEMTERDIQACFSGLRPVLNTGKSDPSKESREHLLFNENGLVTITGGKLTTFRRMAHETLKYIRHNFLSMPRVSSKLRFLRKTDYQELSSQSGIDQTDCIRLSGRYSEKALDVVGCAIGKEIEPIGGSPYRWCELRWAARSEAVVHLDDLLLRRIRLGLTLPAGGIEFLSRIRQTVQNELNWDDQRWDQEEQSYRTQWRHYYSVDSG